MWIDSAAITVPFSQARVVGGECNRGFNYLSPFHRGDLFHQTSTTQNCMCKKYSNNFSCKAIALPKGHAAGVKSASQSSPTTNLGGWGILVEDCTSMPYTCTTL